MAVAVNHHNASAKIQNQFQTKKFCAQFYNDCGIRTSSMTRANAWYQTFQCFLIGERKYRNEGKEAPGQDVKGLVGSESEELGMLKSQLSQISVQKKYTPIIEVSSYLSI